MVIGVGSDFKTNEVGGSSGERMLTTSCLCNKIIRASHFKYKQFQVAF